MNECSECMCVLSLSFAIVVLPKYHKSILVLLKKTELKFEHVDSIKSLIRGSNNKSKRKKMIKSEFKHFNDTN